MWGEKRLIVKSSLPTKLIEGHRRQPQPCLNRHRGRTQRHHLDVSSLRQIGANYAQQSAKCTWR
jgi:hypothetical protein